MSRAVVNVPLGAQTYDVVLAPGLLAELGDLLPRYCPAARYAIIADSHVAAQYGARVEKAVAAVAPVSLHPFAAGEWNKTRERWGVLTDQLVHAGVGRDGAVLALGGGVTGDVAGFVAATFHRGIPYIQLPTTLLAMIDSSVGGKTGVDTQDGKNLVGAFHQPRAVFADVETLDTLPRPELVAGMAEALKHGAVADRAYFDRLLANREKIFAHDRAALIDLVSRSVEIKAAIVGEDERERGKRAVLNFGHTVAHAVETVGGYGVRHGEAVAIGMAVEAALGVRIGITDPADAQALRAALEDYDLPVRPDIELSVRPLLEAMRRDKKARDHEIRWSLISRIGEPARGPKGEWTQVVAEKEIVSTLSSAR